MTSQGTHGSIKPAMELVDALTPDARRGFREFWEIYDRYYEEISAALTVKAKRVPEFAAVMASQTQEQRERGRKEGRDWLKRALVDEEWEAMLQHTRVLGATFAEEKVPFAAWYLLIADAQYLLIPKLHEAYISDPEKMLRAVTAMQHYMDPVMMVLGAAYMESREETIAEQERAIRELSIPILQIQPSLCVIPIIGALDPSRARLLMDKTLITIRQRRTRVMILDVTGVAIIDTDVANRLLQLVEAARLLGTTAIMTGISPEVALAIVSLGLDLSTVKTRGDLESGLEEAARLLRRYDVPPARAESPEMSEGVAAAASEA